MEKITIQNATRRWLDSGFIRIIGSKKLYEINELDYFYKDGKLCRMKMRRRPFCLWTDIENIEHCTTNTEQVVGVIEWDTEKVNSL